MQTVDEIAREIVAREGGYVNDPDDPGGPTKHGVTLTTLRRVGGDFDRDGEVSIKDLKALTQAQAKDIFIRHYFRGPALDRLPAALQPSVFDMYVNAGGQAVKILQRLLGEFGYPVSVDGAIGPATEAAAAQAMAAAPEHLVDAYGIERRNYYYDLADRRAASRKFARRKDGGKGGWIRRAEDFIAPRWHLSRAEHDARVAAWG